MVNTMQTLEVISVNIWHIVISLCNLLILFLIMKKFLYKPVKAVLAKRQAEIDSGYENAEKARSEAESEKEKWSEKLSSADAEADGIIKNAAATASNLEKEIISGANERAEQIVRAAENEAELRRKKADDEIKHEIVGISAALAEKLLQREISEADNRVLIDSFMSEVEGKGSDK